MSDLVVELVPIDSVDTDPKNARQHPSRNLDAIKESLARFGQRKPIVVDGDGIVRAGNGTLEAAKVLGWGEIAIVRTELKGNEAVAYALADNRTGELAEWDTDVLSDLLKNLSAEDVPIDKLGWDTDELVRLVRDRQFATPYDTKLPDEPITKLGDIWNLGDHRLICGDSRDPATVVRLMDGAAAALLVTSPPYNADLPYQGHDDSQDEAQYLAFIESVIGATVPAIMAGGYAAWNIGASRNAKPYAHAVMLESAGMRFDRQVVWAKGGIPWPIWQTTVKAKRARTYVPNFTHEMIYLFSKGEPADGGPIEVDERYSTDVWKVSFAESEGDRPQLDEEPRQSANRHRVDGAYRPTTHGTIGPHPAVFPIALPEGCIKHLTAQGEVVLDPFMGFGTTLIACEKLDRVAYGIELTPAYCDLIVRRWEAFTGDKAEIEAQPAP